jgi:hypothetical protein
MVASVANLIRPIDIGTASLTAAAVAGADQAMISLATPTATGIDGSGGSSFFENTTTATVTDDWYAAWGAFSSPASVDMSPDGCAFVCHFKVSQSSFNNIKGFRLCLRSGSGTSNWGIWEYALTSAGRDGFFHPFMAEGTPDSTVGTFDNTDVTGFCYQAQAEDTGVYAFAGNVDQLVFIDEFAEFGDTGGAATVEMEDYYDLCERFSTEDYRTMLATKAGPTIEFGFGVRVVSDDYAAAGTGEGLAFKSADSIGYPSMPLNFFRFESIPPASGSHVFVNFSAVTNSPDYNLVLDGSAASSSLDITSGLFAGVNDAEISGANLTMSGCTLVSPATCEIADGDLDLSITDSTSAIDFTSDLVSGSAISTDSDIDITFAETDLSDIVLGLTASNTVTVSPTTGSGTYDLSGLTTTGTVNLDNSTANDTTVTLPAGTSNTVESPTAGGGDITVDSPAVTFTFNSDTATTLIRYFEDDSQTIVDSATGTTLAYEYPDTDPVDADFVKQGYVPVNRQDVVPSDGGTLDILMDFDEAYNSSHALTITSEYDYVRATKVLTINSDQEALDVRSSLADVIRTNSSYYNTPLLMVAIPGLTRVDLVDGTTITSMATWKGAGMEMFDSADALNPVEKWFSIKSVGGITGATTHYRQTDSGSSSAITLTSNVVNEAFQYWDDPNHDGSTADGYDYSDYMVIKSFLAGSKQGRVDVLANSGLSALNSNLFTVPLSNESHDYSGSDPGITADITLVSGSTVGGVAFSYEIVDGGTNTGEDIADQLNYNAANNPNTVIPGGTGLTYFELGDMVIHNATAVETERSYEEGTTPSYVGFYASRGGSDHPDFTRFQGDNGTYYTPAITANISITGMPTAGANILLQVSNETAKTSSDWAASTAYSLGDKVLRTSGVGVEETGGLYMVCTVAGTSGGSEPTWDTAVGNTTTDNTVTWTTYAVLYEDSDPGAAGYSSSYTNLEEFSSGDTYRIRFSELDGSTSFKTYETTGLVSSTGFTAVVSASSDTVYALNAVDGSSATVTNKFSPDYSNNEIDLDTNSDYAVTEAFAYYCYELTTTAGMYYVWGGVTGIDSGNYRNNVDVFSIFFDETAGFVKQTDSARWFRSDGTRPARDPTTGGNGIEINWRNPVYAYDGGGGGYSSADRSRDDSIKSKTDSLTFTTAGQVDSNIKYVNDVEVDGAGTTGDPWGPA